MAKNKEEIIDLEGEEWRSVGVWKGVDFTGWYEASNKGRVKSLNRVITDKRGWDTLYGGKLLKAFPNCDGYMTVYLKMNENDKTILLHRLIATLFVPNPDPKHKTQVNHIDEDKSNNCVENLEWVTNGENAIWGTKLERQIKTSGTAVVQLDLSGNLIATFPSIRDVTRKIGLKHGNISPAIRNKRYIAEGYFWLNKSEYDSLSHEELVQKIRTAIYNKEHRIVPDCSKEKEIRAKKKSIVKLSKDGKYLETYASATEAANQNGITIRNINDCLSKRHKTSCGFVWMRLYDFENLNK